MRTSFLRSKLAIATLTLAAIAITPSAHAQSADAGAKVYAANCAACHQASGAGLPGAFPPLAGHFPSLLKQPDGRNYIAKAVLFGVEGSITVNGATFAGSMPPWKALSDGELAAVLNYVGTAFDNKAQLPADFKPYTADDLKAARAQALTPAAVYAQRPGNKAGAAPAASAAAGAPVTFTAAQSARGKETFQHRCTDCHGSTLDNGEFGGAPLNGGYFKNHWGNGSVAALFAYTKAKMPPDRPGGLSDQTYADLVAYLLDENGYAKGDKELPTDAQAQAGMSLKR
ncbi:MAG: cytochrome c, class [Betaproteobacteria bacterium]|nr:cytochrome c, class [Betaproteobacteria bacterium]